MLLRATRMRKEKTMKADVYERITSRIVSELEQGARPWFKPWNAEHAAGRITRPLRANGNALSEYQIENLSLSMRRKSEWRHPSHQFAFRAAIIENICPNIRFD